jgi:hypothetical protein
MTTCTKTLLVGLALSGLLACKDSQEPIQPVIFTNPNEVVLVCFDGSDEAKERAKDDSHYDPTLPLDCCNKVIGTDETDETLEEKLERCGRDATPIAHALITQVQRGEVGAVDLENKKILDSDRRIPGYTFIDVGGLPTAVAIPRTRWPDDDRYGPMWTYVVGREDNAVRAVPTCQFKTGQACGPKVATVDGDPDGDKVFPTLGDYEAATERPLAGEPRDMVLAADGRGLWITLPDAGLLAYVALPEEGVFTPFPEEIVYYPLPGGFDLAPPAPQREEDPYRFACAAGKQGDDSKPFESEVLTMPLSTPADSTRTPRPTLLRLVEVSASEAGTDAAQSLLFVADEGQMALHAYAQDADGVLSLVASMPVGAPLRDFAVTPELPVAAPGYDQLLDHTYYGSGAPTRRYLYAIDARDGSVMAFMLSIRAGVPALMPLLAPEPARDSLHRSLNRADRISIGPDGAYARALDVVNTGARLRSDGQSYDDDPCTANADQTMDQRIKELDKIADQAKSKLEKSDNLSDEEQLAAQRDYVMASENLSVVENAGASSLRGVFLTVATMRGSLIVLDLHDYDLECRVKLQCEVEPDVALGEVIQRHTPRLTGSVTPAVTVSPTTEVELPDACPAGYFPDEEERVCVTGDPWVLRSTNLSVGYEAPITNFIYNGAFEAASRGRLLLKGPEGVDLCAIGANADDRLLVGILDEPDDQDDAETCPVTSFSSVPRLRVLEARTDELLLEPLEDDVDRDTLLACYRTFFAFDIRLEDQYRVSTSSLPIPQGYQHNNMSAADGTCVRDESLDPRFTGRAQLGEPFINQYVAFMLKSELEIPSDAGTDEPETDAGDEDGGDEDGGDEEPPPEDDAGADAGVADAGLPREAGTRPDGGTAEDEVESLKQEVNPTVSLSIEPRAVINASIFGGNSRTDSLPHRVRYFPENGYLFVVDQASQGLRRFFLTPEFEVDEHSNFR